METATENIRSKHEIFQTIKTALLHMTNSCTKLFNILNRTLESVVFLNRMVIQEQTMSYLVWIVRKLKGC